MLCIDKRVAAVLSPHLQRCLIYALDRTEGKNSGDPAQRAGSGGRRPAYSERGTGTGAQPDDAVRPGRGRDLRFRRKRLCQPEAEDLAGAEGYGRQHGAGGLLAALQPVRGNDAGRD